MATPTLEQIGSVTKKNVKLLEMVITGLRDTDSVASLLQRGIDNNFAYMMSINDANRIARALQPVLDHGMVIYLFGSLARSGQGNDIDLVIEMDDSPHLDRLYLYSEEYSLHKSTKDERLNLTTQFLNCDEQLTKELRAARVDIFVLPRGWMDNTQIYQTRFFPHSDQTFLATVARQAVKFDPVRGEFQRRQIDIELAVRLASEWLSLTNNGSLSATGTDTASQFQRILDALGA